ncbi:chaplin [Streptantibioticus ferralitis]|uniref:Chaplin n=1 Tax=Streptantibioticus ferralitis TaxID=236510 RepID=A0ABT5YZ23_9ACTN|nr:chaplin [Streptantibioticus ferralitis]MDF2256851.1 chaplin [Streptantibioticus ferralitis]
MHTAKKAALVLAAAGVAAGATATSASAHEKNEKEFCGSAAVAKTALSPGVISGNVIQVPVDVPVNVVGNTVNAPGILNPAFGNTGAICR